MENDDPEKSVQAFVTQNRKVAEGQLKSLKSEAERLRARLQKVEAGIKRWESLVSALDQSEGARTSPDPRISTQFREVVSSTRSRWKANPHSLPRPTVHHPDRKSTPAKASAVPETVKPFVPR